MMAKKKAKQGIGSLKRYDFLMKWTFFPTPLLNFEKFLGFG